MTPLFPDQTNIFEQTRERLLNNLYVVMAFAFMPNVVTILLRIDHEGWLPLHIWHLMLYGAYLGLVWYRKRIPYRWRAALLLGMWWLSATVTLFQVGPGSDAKTIMVVVVMLAMVLLPLRYGVATALLVMFTIGAAGIAVIWAGWDFAVDYSTRIHRPLSWASSAYNIGLTSGIVAYTVWLMVDTLRRTLRQSEERATQLDKALQRQKAIFASSNAAMGILRDREFVELNDYLAALFGYRPDELLGKTTRLLHLDDEHYARFGERVRVPLEECGHTALEYPFRHRDGQTIWLYVSLMALEGETVIVGIDITELRQARESAETANHAKTAFLANMSHELRTPLNAVLGFADVLTAAPNLDSRQRDYVHAIRGGGDHLLTLINDLLDLAKIEDGHIEMNPVQWSPEVFFPDVLRLFRVRAAEKGLYLRYVVTGSLPATLRSDERHLRQVLMNLLGNAIKFTEKGWVRMSVSYAGGRLSVEVADTGMGIASGDIEHIFERFRQAASGQHGGQGTGLGLSISRRLVDLMGGQLSVSSTPGEGSVFKFEVPVTVVDAAGTQSAPSAQEAPAAVNSFAANPRGDGGPPRVLVVDDVAHNRMLLAALLEPIGFVIEEAADGMACLERVATAAPDAVLVDLRLPDIDGLEVTRRLRAMGYPGALVMVSASAFESDYAASIEAGCDAFFPKPVRFAELGEVLGRLGLVVATDTGPVAGDSDVPGHTVRGERLEGEGLLDLSVLELNNQLIAPPRLASILDEFARHAEQQLPRLVEALRGGCHDDARQVLHRLAGGAGMLGLRRLQQLCGRLERSVATTPPPDVEASVEELLAVYAASLAALKAAGNGKAVSVQ